MTLKEFAKKLNGHEYNWPQFTKEELATDRVEIDGKMYYRMLTDEKIREKYKDLKEYHIDNHSQKYVKLEENDGTAN